MDRAYRIKEEIKGVLLLVSGLIIFVSLISHNPWDRSIFTTGDQVTNLLGRFGAELSEMLIQVTGYASYLFPIVLSVTGIKMILGRTFRKNKFLLIISFTLLITSVSTMLSLTFKGNVLIHPGGALGIILMEPMLKFLSRPGVYIILGSITVICLMYLVEVSLIEMVLKIWQKMIIALRAIAYMKSAVNRVNKKLRRSRTVELKEEEEIEYPEVNYEQEKLPLIDDIKPPSPPPVRHTQEKRISTVYVLPGLDLLKDPPPSRSRPSKEELQERAELLVKKLSDYDIEGRVKHISPGPIVTMFEFEPAPGIKISRVMALADDLAMALKASSIRISPIHGRSTLGIEVPNKDREDVYLKEIIASEQFQKSPSKLTIALGKDIFGAPVMADLSKMPHLLIAGATGSGKSVGLNSIILSLLYRATPREVKMLMIDPKMLELSAYDGIPHLLMPVVTIPKEASNALKKLVIEMERRYRQLAESGTRHIETYNRKIEAEKKSDPSRDDLQPLPYIVIIIDELADLMFAAGREVEDSIARLAQMARAAGIHLILATQRPSVDVITGIIKANFPSRISFQVSSKLDSRIILDTYGAEQLLGKGDMLFTSPGRKLRRIHGAYVSEEEIRNVVNFIKAQEGPDYSLLDDIVPEEEGEVSKFEEEDELYARAKELVMSAGQASISFIQRRMKIGYNRAARIMEMLEEEGIVGPPGEAGKPREVLRRH